MTRCKNCGKFIDDIEKRAMCPHCGTGIARASRVLDEYNRPDDYECVLHPLGEECKDDSNIRIDKNRPIPTIKRPTAKRSAYNRQESPNFEQSGFETKPNEMPKGTEMTLSILSYFGGLVFFPIVSLPTASNFVRFHANQGLLLFVYTIVVIALESFIQNSSIIYSYYFLLQVFRILKMITPIFSLYGILNAIRGKTIRLPIFGGIDIIKPRR